MPAWGSRFRSLSRLRKLLAIAVAALATAAGGTVTLVANLDALQARYQKWHHDWDYQNTLRRPYPDLLTDKDIEGWSSGRLQLALFQIDGYLGRLKSSPAWIKQCLRDRDIFPENYASQYNDRLDSRGNLYRPIKQGNHPTQDGQNPDQQGRRRRHIQNPRSVCAIAQEGLGSAAVGVQRVGDFDPRQVRAVSAAERDFRTTRI